MGHLKLILWSRLLFLRLFVLVAAVLLSVPPRGALADSPLFAAREGVALGGYDTVAFFDVGEAVAGQARYSVVWKGVIWRFASQSNQIRFEMDPRAYAPMFGGYCASAMARGVLKAGDPQLWVIVDGRLFLLNNEGALTRWRAQAAQLIAEADAHWPAALHPE